MLVLVSLLLLKLFENMTGLSIFTGIPGIAADVRSKGRGRGTLTDIPGTTEVRGRGRSAPRMEKLTQYNRGGKTEIDRV